ncbi:MAG: hypothetical protein ACTSPQ_20470 [Candidatus Helarchaeota archaeon]
MSFIKSWFSKIKNKVSKHNSLEIIKNELKEYQQKAQVYLEILRRLEQRIPSREIFDLPPNITGEPMRLTREEFEFIEANSALLQEQCNKFGLGVGFFREALGMGYYRRFEFIVNFPIRYKNPVMRDDALGFLSYIKTALTTYIHKVDEILKNKQKLKEYVKKSSKSNNNQSRLRLDKTKAKIIEFCFSVVYAISIGLLIVPEYFISGLTLNIFSVTMIILIFFLVSEENE